MAQLMSAARKRRERLAQAKRARPQVVLHPGQSDVLRYLFPGAQGADGLYQHDRCVRYATVCASRGFGKSVLASAAANIAVDYLMRLPRDVPNKNVSIIAPTYSQVTDIYWPLLTQLFNLEVKSLESSRADGFFLLPNNVTLSLWSYEASERMRGSGQFFTVQDEVTTWTGKPGHKESWESIIQPTMTTRWPGNHRSLTISTPKGFDYFYDLYNMEITDPERYKSFLFDFTKSPYLSAEEIERVRKTTDPIKFAREYQARFEDSGTSVFYCFSRKRNVRPDLPALADGEPVHVSIDFNVGIMASTVWAVRGDQMHAIGELDGYPDTAALAKRLKLMFPDRKIIAYPDPAGRARKTSSPTGQTDFAILEAHGITTRAHKAHPPIVDSVAAVNAKLLSADDRTSMFFCPNRAPKTIRSMERTSWSETNVNVATIDKKGGEEHFSDGTRYITEFLFPITNQRKSAMQGWLT